MKQNLHLGVPSARNDDEEEFDLKDLLNQLLARKWWIVTAVVLGTFIGAFWGQLGPNTYRASSVVQIESRSDGVNLPEELIGQLLGNPSTPGSLATEIHIIKSRLILGPVIDELNLSTRTEALEAPIVGEVLARRSIPIFGALFPARFARADEAVHARFLEPPEDEIGQTYTLTVTAADAFELSSDAGDVWQGTVGVPLALGDGTRLIVDSISAPVRRSYTVWYENTRAGAARLARDLSVRERGATGIVDFSFSGSDKQAAVMIVNSIVRAYQRSNIERQSVRLDRSIEFLEQQLELVRGDLAEADQLLLEYRERDEFQNLSQNTQSIVDQAVVLERELEQLRFQENQLSQRLTPNHPEYREVLQRQDLVEQRLEDLRSRLEVVPEQERELARLSENVSRLAAVEQQLLERAEQLRVQRASAVGNIRILEVAEEATLIGPDRRRPILIGLALGFILSSAGILGVNFLRQGIDDAKAIEQLGLSLFATVNRVDGLRSGGGQVTALRACGDPPE